MLAVVTPAPLAPKPCGRLLASDTSTASGPLQPEPPCCHRCDERSDLRPSFTHVLVFRVVARMNASNEAKSSSLGTSMHGKARISSAMSRRLIVPRLVPPSSIS